MQKERPVPEGDSLLTELKGLVRKAVSRGLPGIREEEGGGIWVNGNFYGWQNLEENPGLVQKLIGTIRQFIERYTVEQA
ncbi:MAG: hypothetical protein Q6K14_07265, partial [Gloeomargarita sp. GMQP_bins_44]